jgi:hypothetical protein
LATSNLRIVRVMVPSGAANSPSKIAMPVLAWNVSTYQVSVTRGLGGAATPLTLSADDV